MQTPRVVPRIVNCQPQRAQMSSPHIKVGRSKETVDGLRRSIEQVGEIEVDTLRRRLLGGQVNVGSYATSKNSRRSRRRRDASEMSGGRG